LPKRFVLAVVNGGVYTLAVGVFVGLLVPPLAHALRPLMVWAIGGLLVLSMMRIDWVQVLALIRNPVKITFAVTWLLLLSPLAVWTIAGMPSAPTGLTVAVILMAASAPITSSPAMVALIGLDADLSLVVLIAATLLVPFTLPIVSAFIGVELTISSLALFARLCAFVGACTVVAVVLRYTLGAEKIFDAGQGLNMLAVFLLIVFAIAIMDGVTQKLLGQPVFVLKVIAISCLANAGLLMGVSLAHYGFGRRQALTVGFSAANCNMGLLWAVLPSDSDPDIFLYFAVAQIPMYISPAIIRKSIKAAAWVR